MHAWSSKNLADFDVLVFDCDGVIWKDTSSIPGAADTIKQVTSDADTINKLQAMGKTLYFCSNNSTKSRAQYTKKFKEMGMTVTAPQIFNSSYAAAACLLQQPGFDQNKHKCFTIGGPGIGLELKERGVQTIEARTLLDKKHFSREEMCKIKLDPAVKGVLVGSDEFLTYTKVAHAMLYLNENPGCIFISTNQDNTFPSDGRVLPGGGSCVAMVAWAAMQQPINTGKPSNFLMQLIKERNPSLDPKRTLMIGDRLETDILFGKSGGFRTCLVSTGIHGPNDVAKSDIKPDFCLPSIAELFSPDIPALPASPSPSSQAKITVSLPTPDNVPIASLDCFPIAQSKL
eukprot:g44757.t1